MPRVLVIDDDLMLSQMLREHLVGEGLEVVSASMAGEGLDLALETHPDLIMLDVQLPDATGFQACGKLREDPRTRSIPIIMMTGSARFPNQQAIGRRLGATDYVLKPFNIVEIGDKVHTLLGLRPPARMEGPEKVEKREPEPPSVQTSAAPSAQHGIKLIPTRSEKPLTDPFVSNFKLSAPHVAVEEKQAVIALEEVTAPVEDMKLTPAPVTPEALVSEPPPIFQNLPRTLPTNPSVLKVETSLPSPVEAVETPPTEESLEALSEEKSLPSEEEQPQPWQDFQEEIKPLSLSDSLLTLSFTWKMLTAHILLTMACAALTPNADVLQSATFVAGGWALLMGVLVPVSAVLKMTLTVKETWQILGLTSAPIVLRSLLTLIGTCVPSVTSLHVLTSSKPLPASIFWSRPWDVFELAAIAVLGYALGKQPGSTLKKCFITTAFVALVWALTSRGYFRPF